LQDQERLKKNHNSFLAIEPPAGKTKPPHGIEKKSKKPPSTPAGAESDDRFDDDKILKTHKSRDARGFSAMRSSHATCNCTSF
jgi:hypothetical protein